MSMADILLGLVIAAGMYFALKYIGHSQNCKHNCSECKHPCRTRR